MSPHFASPHFATVAAFRSVETPRRQDSIPSALPTTGPEPTVRTTFDTGAWPLAPK